MLIKSIIRERSVLLLTFLAVQTYNVFVAQLHVLILIFVSIFAISFILSVHVKFPKRKRVLENIAKLENELFGEPEHTPFPIWPVQKCPIHRWYIIREKGNLNYVVCVDCGCRNCWHADDPYYRDSRWADDHWIKYGVWSGSKINYASIGTRNDIVKTDGGIYLETKWGCVDVTSFGEARTSDWKEYSE